jgi:hypothetical protein
MTGTTLIPTDWSVWRTTSAADIEDPSHDWDDSEKDAQLNPTLMPDWDVINKIRWTLQLDAVDGGRIIHIAGHQDRRTEYNKLNLQAQLNVDADRLASEYQDRYGQVLPIVLRFPHTAAQLHLSNHGTCTYRYHQNLRRSETERPLLEYIITRNKWTHSQAETIDWDAHERAIKSHNKKRIHITKLVHDILPTNKNVHRQQKQNQRCLTCKDNPSEDRDHILRCQHTTRAQWRADTITKMEHKCKELNTDPKMARILIDGVHRWLDGNDEPLQTHTYASKYGTLIRQQNAIGWRQIFSGRMSREWARLQDDFIYIDKQRRRDLQNDHRHRSTIADRRNGTRWTATMIQTIWEQWFVVWALRNADVHGHDRRTRAEALARSNRGRLQEIYDSRRQLEPSVEALLSIQLTRTSNNPNTI